MALSPGRAGALCGASTLPLQAQVCVVGAGIAGLVLADRLVRRGVDVLVLEAGGPEATSAPEESGPELTGVPHRGSRLDRMTGVGGSAGIWGGQLLPLPPDAEWPVPLPALERFYPDVQRLLRVDAFPYDGDAFFAARREPVPPAFHNLPGVGMRMSQFAPFSARNLGHLLGAAPRQDARARLLVATHVTGLCLTLPPEGNERVQRVEALTADGKRLSVQADWVVLAAGTVESCRLLLSASRTGEASRGFPALPALGRSFHDHLTVEIAEFTGPARARAAALFRPWMGEWTRSWRGLWAPGATVHALKLEADPRLRQRFGLQHALAHVTFTEPEGSGAAAVRALLRSRQAGRGSAAGKQTTGQGPTGRRALPLPWSNLGAGLRQLGALQLEAVRAGRRYVSPQSRVALRVNIAQKVTDQTFIVLTDQADAHGVPRARVHWAHDAADLRTIRLFADHLRRHWAAAGLPDPVWNAETLPLEQPGAASASAAAEAEHGLDRPIPALEDARHAMGGARLGIDARSSVVDVDLRVHGTSNLFVASAAVFPDGAPQLPTLTLMTLAMRLAEHLAALVTGR